MKVSINLATQPYENLRPLYAAVGAATVLLAALILVVVLNAQHSRNESRVLTEQTNRLNKEMTDLRREQRDLTEWLARPVVQEIRERSFFLNSLITRKSLSWTRMFLDLEKVLPERVQVNTIRPSTKQSADTGFNLGVSAASVQPLIEFLKNLEASPQFGSPVVDSQRFPAEKAMDTNIVLDLNVRYHQTNQAPAASSEEAKKDAAVADASGVQKGDR